jgi:hypothetical protein
MIGWFKMLSLEQVQRVCGSPAWVWRELETGGLSVVLKSGQKHRYSAEQVQAVVTDPKAAELDPVTNKPAKRAARKK